ncbi:MAG: peptide deformylase [bacterium]|jgi:peptide deformylase
MPPSATIDAPEIESSSTDTSTQDDKYNRPFDDSKIIKYGTPEAEVLRRVAAEVTTVDTNIRALIREMGELMYTAHGVGLAAPQVGKSLRIFVYDAGDGLRALINPRLSKFRGEQYEPEEGCLSIPGLRGVVRRAREVNVQALDRDGRPVRFRAVDFEARVIQHEYDHLDGILFIDHADPKTLHMLTADEQASENSEPLAE